MLSGTEGILLADILPRLLWEASRTNTSQRNCCCTPILASISTRNFTTRKMRLTALLPRVLVFLLSVSLVAAIYQDEAYQIDYQHALLGTPISDNTFFHQPSISSRATLLYTLSEKNVLGAINPKDGSLVWRQSLASSTSNGTQGFLRATNGTSVIVSAVGNTVRSWEAADGKLLWQYEDIGTVLGLTVPDITGKTQDPLVVTYENGNTRITMLNSINGKVVWQVADSV